MSLFFSDHVLLEAHLGTLSRLFGTHDPSDAGPTTIWPLVLDTGSPTVHHVFDVVVDIFSATRRSIGSSPWLRWRSGRRRLRQPTGLCLRLGFGSDSCQHTTKPRRAPTVRFTHDSHLRFHPDAAFPTTTLGTHGRRLALADLFTIVRIRPSAAFRARRRIPRRCDGVGGSRRAEAAAATADVAVSVPRGINKHPADASAWASTITGAQPRLDVLATTAVSAAGALSAVAVEFVDGRIERGGPGRRNVVRL